MNWKSYLAFYILIQNLSKLTGWGWKSWWKFQWFFQSISAGGDVISNYLDLQIIANSLRNIHHHIFPECGYWYSIKIFLWHSIKIFSLQVPDRAVRAGRGAAEAESDHGLPGGAAAAVREEQGRGGAEQAAQLGHRSWSQLCLLTLTSCVRHPSW